MTTLLRPRQLSSAPLTPQQVAYLTEVASGMGYDLHDCNGISLTGVDIEEARSLEVACDTNHNACALLIASETEGARVGIVDDTLMLIEQG